MNPDAKLPRRKYPVHQVVDAVNRPTIVFVTVCTQNHQPLLANAAAHEMLREVWSAASAWVVGRYVLMPDHVHFFAAPGSPELPLTNWISFWKRAFTRRLGEAIWQEDYWDTTLRNYEHASDRWAYIRQNPIRAGLVSQADDWHWQGELHQLTWP